MTREAFIQRETAETAIDARFVLDSKEQTDIRTPLPFMNHMLEAFGMHGGMGIEINAKGDTEADAHHLVEDLGLVLGEAFNKALDEKHSIARFGTALIPMDDALSRVVIDISGRPFLAYRGIPQVGTVGSIRARLFREFFQAFINKAGVTAHIDLLAGEELHHVVEAAFKAFGRALATGAALTDNTADVPSTKGTLE